MFLCFFLPGVRGAFWEAPSHSAGTHQDGAALPIQPGWPNTLYILRGHHHKGWLNSFPSSVDPFLSVCFLFFSFCFFFSCLCCTHSSPSLSTSPSFLPNSWHVLSLPPPTCLTFVFSAIDCSSWIKLPARLNRSSKRFFRSPWCFHLPLPVTLNQLFCRPLHLSILHPPPFVSSSSFSLSLPAAMLLSIGPYLPPALVLTVCNCIVYVCVFQAVTLRQPPPFMLRCSFPLSSSPLSSPPPPSSSLLFADRPVHCSTSFPLWQRSTSLHIHAAAAYAITILGPSATYSEAIEMHDVWHVLARKWKCVFRC